MSKAATSAQRIKELEEEVAQLSLTVQAQSESIVGYVNRELDLRREITYLRAFQNGKKADAE